MKRHELLKEIGCTASAIYQWRDTGNGQPEKVAAMKPAQTDDEILDWLIAAGQDLGIEEALIDRLLGHRVRWNKKGKR